MINEKRIDKVLQYTLLIAGQEDDYFDRDLGPIHLIKYLYLADLAFAEIHNGETYTSIPWRFYHYGPWEISSFERIDPALLAINADKKTIQSAYYEDDFVRWAARDDDLATQLYDELPLPVSGAIGRYVHQFGKNTGDLLHFVYSTLPMISAAPGENLDFSPLKKEPAEPDPAEDQCQVLTKRQEKKRSLALQALKAKMRQRIDSRPKKQEGGFTPPRYDEVFFEGLNQLDQLAGDSIEPGKYIAIFSEDIWKSKARHDPELP